MKIKIQTLFLWLCCALALHACKSKQRVYDSAKDTQQAGKGAKKKYAVGKFNKIVKSNDMGEKYKAAIKYFENESYSKALILFDELATVYKGSEKGEEVSYYQAYCNYNLGDYLISGYQFRTYVRNYPGGKHAEECAYMNAYCYYLNSPQYKLDQVDTKLAIKEFQRFAQQYPKSEYIPKCNEILDILREKLEKKSFENAMLFFNTENYKSAILSFQNHLKDFPDTKQVEEINYMIIKSNYLLAENSIEEKKEERYKNTVDSYLKFVDKYPSSKYLKDAETLYSSSLKTLEKYKPI